MAMKTFVICTHPIPFSLISQPSVKPLVFSLLSLLLLQDSGCRSVYKLPTKNNFQLDCRYETWGQSVFNNKLIWHRVFPSPHNSTSLLLYLDILSLNWKRKETRTKSLLPSSIHKQDFISIQTFILFSTASETNCQLWCLTFDQDLSRDPCPLSSVSTCPGNRWLEERWAVYKSQGEPFYSYGNVISLRAAQRKVLRKLNFTRTKKCRVESHCSNCKISR